MRNKEFWYEKFSKVYDNVEIKEVHYFDTLTEDIRREHGIFCKNDRGIYLVYYKYKLQGTKQKRKWIYCKPIKEERKEKLDHIHQQNELKNSIIVLLQQNKCDETTAEKIIKLVKEHDGQNRTSVS